MQSNIGRFRATSGQSPVTFGKQIGPDLNDIRPMLENSRQMLDDIGPNSVDVGHIPTIQGPNFTESSHACQIWLKAGKFSPMSVDFGPNLADTGRFRTIVREFGPIVVEDWPSLANSGPMCVSNSVEVRPKLADSGPNQTRPIPGQPGADNGIYTALVPEPHLSNVAYAPMVRIQHTTQMWPSAPDATSCGPTVSPERSRSLSRADPEPSVAAKATVSACRHTQGNIVRHKHWLYAHACSLEA